MIENWFDSTIELNHGLVAVIGNKGSGKSALADILGLLGDSLNGKSFSFLTPNRFCQSKDNKGSQFDATICWESGGTATRRLDETVPEGTVESVRYLPQSFIESVCNELGDRERGRFGDELSSVIFSHVDHARRLGHSTLDSLIDYISAETRNAIALLRSEIGAKVRVLCELERQLGPQYQRSLMQKLESIERELRSHDEAKPAQVMLPSEGGTERKAAAGLAAHQQRAQELLERVKSINSGRESHSRRVAAADRLLARIENIERVFANFETASQSDFQELDLTQVSVMQFRIERSYILSRRAESVAAISDADRELDQARDGSAISLANIAVRDLEEKRQLLDRPMQMYEKFLKETAEWQARRDAIVGAEDAHGTLRFLQREQAMQATLSDRLDSAWSDCLKLSIEIYRAIQKLASIYRDLHSPVQRFIERHQIEHIHISFQTSIEEEGFVDEFLRYILHNKKGSFSGSTEGRSVAVAIAKRADFSTEGGIVSFLDEVRRSLQVDTRRDRGETMQVGDQLAKGRTPEELYAYVLGLTYLRPRYTLRWAGKDVAQLSPGERGILLLIFYLLIDKSDVPIIIDQPEENLDNQTIYNVLVPSIRDARNRRQIIIVTHNPNLAVVCDADQVIVASIDKLDGHRVTYRSGSIENSQINKHLVDVLEGTRPAFENRGAKYHSGIRRRPG